MSPRQMKNANDRVVARVLLFLVIVVTMAAENVYNDAGWDWSTGIIWGVSVLLVLAWMDAGRSLERSSVSRIVWRGYVFFFLMFWFGRWGVFELTQSLAEGWLQSMLFPSIMAIVWLAMIIPIGVFSTTFWDKMFLRNDSAQKWFEANGGHSWWDGVLMPSFLNPDSELTRMNGVGEPFYTDFVPPKEWWSQCPECGSRIEGKSGCGSNPGTAGVSCWNCGYGKGGKGSGAFGRRWGAAYRAQTGREWQANRVNDPWDFRPMDQRD